ncbi:efflux RND transporter periplasmic adaptor subunit [Duganella sp. FT80W]|uniref:Efflux RND transporter periplasmic adaptor subunit n=1 Tax=Duganella guangzhouensis TaxID=2666084 RepID=A0A6I2LBH1_9BURK|nr:efflux RND transporter periplasmic adaptor subunit [Duganella guangzhouensis]MRW93619.1 efflux RND transporter periplasmic adaptor subunit [Duganella guangzhouensis]
MNKTPLKNFYLPSLVAIAAVALTGWSLVGLHAKEAPAPEPVAALVHDGEVLRIPERSPLRRSLVVAAMPEQSVSVPFTLPAVVEADPARLARVLPPLAGRIVRLNKQLGDAVRAGEVLFVIDAPDFAQANADAAKAQSALLLARRNLERQRELARSDIAAGRDVEQAQSDYEQAASEAARATARLAQAGGAAHGGSGGVGAGAAADGRTAGGGQLAVRSPLSGRVVALAATEGAYWNDATAPLMTVADLSKVYISANAQEKDLAQLYVGQQASVRLDAYPAPLKGQVAYVGEMLDADTRTVKVRLPFDNRDGRLKPGMFAEATLEARPHAGIVVPMSAVIQSGFSSRAFVEVKPWQFAPRDLKLGAQIGEQVEVLSGLKPGERVVVKDGVLLND